MPFSRRERQRIRRARIRRRRVAGLLVVVAAVAAVGCDRLLPSSSSTGSPFVRVVDGDHRRPPGQRAPSHEPPGAPGRPPAGGSTVFDDGRPDVAKLDPALLRALRRAATDAARDGVALRVDSGWRSPQAQQRLLDDAVLEHGSPEEAARWVATPDRSAHVSGDAVDIGPSDATAWLSRHGAAYGLCQIYGNEPWHYELRPEAGVQGCPPMYADPTHDPRLRP